MKKATQINRDVYINGRDVYVYERAEKPGKLLRGLDRLFTGLYKASKVCISNKIAEETGGEGTPA